MKKISIILITLVVTLGCAELDLEPQNGLTEGVAFQDPANYERYLAKLYASFILTGQDGPDGDGDITIVNDEGFTSYIRAYWKAQELTTDEAVIAWTDAGIRDMHDHNWVANNQFIRVIYYRIFYIVSLCNDFLEQSSDGNLSQNGISEEDRVNIGAYRDEARFLRALAYSHALDFFRKVPVFEELGFTPLQSEPEELFDWIEQELLDLESVLPDPQIGFGSQYGRAHKAAVWMLQARLYLNAEVYTGEARYDEVVTAVNKVNSSGYELESNYADLFKADNHLSREMIYPIVSDGTNAQNWGGTTFLVSGAIGGYMSDNLQDGTESSSEIPFDKETVTNYGVSGGWGGMRTTSAMLDKFNYDEVNQDPRLIYYDNGQSVLITNIGEFQEGVAIPKYINRTKDDEVGSNQDHVDTDIPYFRLGDAYLMYAEATARGASNGVMATATEYINALRDRARGEGTYPLAISEADLTTDFVMDERVREMYWEGTRRMDLIRDGKFISGYNWPWKAGVNVGRDSDPYRIVFPIPQSQIETNSAFEQYFSEYE